ncbi:MCE family protein [Marmoricola sp. URHB0036]|uniref:MCE family protein n=1 Tax=Marmoricola sp. URHB0036 TaxID=1298863 RepID=UPI000684B53B|nr:MCE family protein [Marmoricola sp. URHB0036]
MNRLSGKVLGAVVVLLLLVAGFVSLRSGGADSRHVTAYFDRTVSIYKGSEVRVMGVNIGTVDAVVPEGDRVRVSMTYDGEYKLPADAKAAIVTPTLTADRFVQIAPAYTGGPVMQDNAKIALPDTGTPVELDRIYQSLSDLTQALGPNGANKNGALDTLLTAGAKALRGNGKLGNETLLNLSAAVQTFGDSSGPLFNSVQNMSQLTDTLAANDRFVDGFMSDLTSVSSQLAADRGNLAKALAALANAVGTVRTFVHDNKGMVEKDVKELTRLLGVTARHKDDLNTLARIGALGLDNLTIAYDNKSRSIGSRINVGENGANLGNMLCDIIVNSGKFPGDSSKNTCDLLRTIVAPFADQIGADPSENHSAPAQLKLGGSAPVTSLAGLLNALKAGNKS